MNANAATFIHLCTELELPARNAEQRADLRNRIMAQTHARPGNLVQAEEGEFVRVLQGVYVKRLRADALSETSLWRLAPGAVIPAHGHSHDEECVVLSGGIRYLGRDLTAGDYLGAQTGEHQSAITSPDGAMLLIRGERLVWTDAQTRA
jgi:quercetin dioxygenase-like cupin family protein